MGAKASWVLELSIETVWSLLAYCVHMGASLPGANDSDWHIPRGCTAPLRGSPQARPGDKIAAQFIFLGGHSKMFLQVSKSQKQTNLRESRKLGTGWPRRTGIGSTVTRVLCDAYQHDMCQEFLKGLNLKGFES